MEETIQARLEELRKELVTGQTELEKLEAQRTYLRETILRIGGAIQVLEELLAQGRPSDLDGHVSEQRQPARAQDQGV